MSSFKKLSKADVTTTPYIANKQWVLAYTSLPNDSYCVFYTGQKGNFNITGSQTENNQYKSLVYSSINHLFYQKYTDLLDTGSLMFNVNTYTSASQQRPTSSYFDYNINPLFVDNFPTSSSSLINVLSINQDIFGSKILPYSFVITSSVVNIRDDGNGNLYDSGSIHIGNIFYSHGLIVITDQNYASSSIQFDTSGDFAFFFKNEHIIYENEVRCIVKESDYNLSYNPTLTTNYYSGSLKNFATSSNFYPYTTTIGLYNDDNELLMVAKLAKPMMISPNTDMTFIVKYDT